MADESNASSGFQYSKQTLLFRSVVMSSEMIPLGSGVGGSGTYFGSGSGSGMVGGSGTSLIMNSGDSSSNFITGNGNSPGIIHGAPALGICSSGSGSGSLLLDSVPGLKHNAGLAVEWSPEEQYKLEKGLIKFADEPSIMRYIKIAATLRDKTVRDVALRCRWMTRKRRKPEEQMAGKNFNNRKDKPVESLSRTNVSPALPMNITACSSMMQQMGQNENMPFEGISGTMKHLFEQNSQAFSQISGNLSTFKQLRDNIDLFCRARNNITTILNDMRRTPGVMSQMPPLPVSINEDLANTILSNTTQGFF